MIKPASNERKTFAGKVHHGGRKIELPVEPWFDGMLIGGGDDSEMAQHERAHVTRDKLGRKELIRTGPARPVCQVPYQKCGENDGGCERQPAPSRLEKNRRQPGRLCPGRGLIRWRGTARGGRKFRSQGGLNALAQTRWGLFS